MKLKDLPVLIGAAALALGAVGAAPAPAELDAVQARLTLGQSAVPGVGETDLFNFEHVYNFNLANVNAPVGERAVDNQGTDIDFFTSTVVVRDADGDRIGPDGAKLDAADADYVAERDFAVVGDHSSGVAIFDITDPESTYLASYQVCGNPRSDVGVFQWTDATTGELRTIIGSSRESGAMCKEAGPQTTVKATDQNPLTSEEGGVSMFEVTDPYNPQPFARVQVGAGGAHNFKFHPTAPVAYAWNGEIGGGEVSSVQIIDLRPVVEDGEDPSQILSYIGPTTLGSVHDGELSPDGSVMYLASEYNYSIFDNSDPFNPKQIGGMTPNPGTYAHGYFPTPDGNIGITNNESLALGGFFGPGGSGVCPGEGLGFHDTSIPELVPGPIGYFVPPVQGKTIDSRACTSHFGNVASNNVVMSVGWYVLGGRVIDFAVPSLPVEIGAATFADGPDTREVGTEAWSAKTYKGPYMYVGDMGRGFDVFKWTGPEECGNPFDDTYDSDCLINSGQFRTPVQPTSSSTSSATALPQPQSGDVRSWRFSCQL